ncbi:MAG: hypothetical protein OXN27_25260 [Candidatus Poribacteria bacterium]|nr:hypothetical protein [Candidatus Poribacteria bacterium]
MISAILTSKGRSIAECMVLVVLFCAIGIQMGFAEKNMNEKDFQISIDAQRVEFTAPPIFRNGEWFVPLEGFAKQLDLKVEYPEGAKMVVLCGGKASELCVPLQLGDDEKGAVEIGGVVYARPAHIAEPFGFEIYEVASNALEVVQPVHLAPEFTLPDLEGIPKHLKDFRGKKTFLYVWGSW